MIVLERIDNQRYSFANSKKEGMKMVARILTFNNTDPYAYSSKIRMFDKKEKTFRIGMLENVLSYCRDNRVQIEMYDYDYETIGAESIDERLKGKYIHQQRAVTAFFKRRFGILKVPTRGGKTFIASEIIRQFLRMNKNGRFLFVVDSVDLFNQAKGDFQKFFAPYGGIKIGEIKDGKVDFNQTGVTIAMAQTLQSVFSKRNSDRKKRSLVSKYLKSVDFLCVDEIHDNFSASRKAVYNRCSNISFFLGLSATPYKSENFVQNLYLQEWTGGVVYEISEKILRERGVLSQYKVFLFIIDHNEKEIKIENDDYNEYRQKIILTNEDRDNYMVRIIESLNNMGLKTLVLFQSVGHGKAIGERMGIPFISGETKSAERQERTKEFLSNSDGVLFASGIFKKGITLPEAQVLINADGGLEDANTTQKKGRVLGSTETKNRSLIIDFIDIFDVYFSEHSETRLNNYVNAIGEDNVGLLDTSADDCFSVFENWVKRWFNITGNYSVTR